MTGTGTRTRMRTRRILEDLCSNCFQRRFILSPPFPLPPPRVTAGREWRAEMRITWSLPAQLGSQVRPFVSCSVSCHLGINRSLLPSPFSLSLPLLPLRSLFAGIRLAGEHVPKGADISPYLNLPQAQADHRVPTGDPFRHPPHGEQDSQHVADSRPSRVLQVLPEGPQELHDLKRVHRLPPLPPLPIPVHLVPLVAPASPFYLPALWTKPGRSPCQFHFPFSGFNSPAHHPSRAPCQEAAAEPGESHPDSATVTGAPCLYRAHTPA